MLTELDNVWFHLKKMNNSKGFIQLATSLQKRDNTLTRVKRISNLLIYQIIDSEKSTRGNKL